MATEVTVIRCQDGSLRPATNADAEAIAAEYKIGQAVRIKSVRVNPRSLQHHRLYWGGLIELAFDYWEPTGGMISASELYTLKRFSRWLDRKTNSTGAIHNACKSFLTEIRRTRASKIECPTKTKQALHEWIKIEAGYFDYQVTPTGIKKTAKSINFNSMDQSEFNLFYKSAFGVVWNFILSRSFNSEDQAQNAIDQLLNIGYS